jgi:L-serine dehydratase
MNGSIQRVLIEFDTKGSLASTHSSQGSDMGLFGGLLGWDAHHDERLLNAAAALEQEKIHIELRTGEYHDVHPNTYRLTLSNEFETHSLIALSTGGGMIEIVMIDGIPLSIKGDYVETLISVKTIDKETYRKLKDTLIAEEILLHTGKEKSLIEIRSREPLIHQLDSEGLWIRTLMPVLPVLSSRKMQVPFATVAEMLEWNRQREIDLSGIALAYESARGGVTDNEVHNRMKSIVIILRRSIEQGLRGTQFKDRILGAQSAAFKTAIEKGNLLDAGMLNAMIRYVTFPDGS